MQGYVLRAMSYGYRVMRNELLFLNTQHSLLSTII